MLRDSSPPVPPAPRAMLLLFIAVLLLWFGSLNGFRAATGEELRLAARARALLASGDWLHPGSGSGIEPPLPLWATAAALHLFGEHDWTLRLWSALTGFAGILLALITAGRLWGLRCGVIAAGVLASTPAWTTAGHASGADAGFFLQLALSGLLLANRDALGDTLRRNWMLVAWAGAGLAVLTLGPPALLLGLALLLAYGLVGRDLRPFGRLHLRPGLPLFLLIAAPWLLVAAGSDGGLGPARLLESLRWAGPGSALPASPFPALLLASLPWTLLAAHGAWAGWGTEHWPDFQPLRLLLLWCLVVAGIAVASGTPQPAPVIAMLPALAMFAAWWLHRAGSRGQRRHFLIIAGLALLALPLLLRQVAPLDLPGLATLGCIGLAALAASFLANAGRTLIAPLLLALASLAALTLLPAALSPSDPTAAFPPR